MITIIHDSEKDILFSNKFHPSREDQKWFLMYARFFVMVLKVKGLISGLSGNVSAIGQGRKILKFW